MRLEKRSCLSYIAFNSNVVILYIIIMNLFLKLALLLSHVYICTLNAKVDQN